MKNKIIISAYNIHTGGGKTLLTALLESLPKDSSVHALLDERLTLDLSNNYNLTVTRIKPTVFNRLIGEFKIKRESKNYDSLVCFGNLPPLFKSNIKTTIFLQNKFLISKNFVCWRSTRTIVRSIIEKIWFSLKKSKKYLYIVQTQSMKRAFILNQGNKLNIKVCGFTPDPSYQNVSLQNMKKDHDFIYVASGEPHKNHNRLIDAWKILAESNQRPKLTLVLGDFEVLKRKIKNEAKKYKLNIEIFSTLPRKEVLSLYKKSKALIYPSLIESFGLPLIEAHQLNLPLITSESDFVRDIANPSETFDPRSAVSISRAVLRFLEVKSKSDMRTTKEFFDLI